MRWRRFAFWITFSMLALIVLACIWLWTADLAVFRPQLERFVTEQTGRAFAIEGEFHVDLSRHATVTAEDVRFGNAEWADTDDMVTIGRVELRLDLWSLFKGPLLVELIDLDDTEILLLNPGGREPNWRLPREAAARDENAAEQPGIDVLFASIDVDNLRLRLESVERDRPLNLVVERFDQAHRDDDFLDLELRATLDGRRIGIDGEIGTWAALLAGKDVEADLDAVLDTFTLSARGRIDDFADVRKPQFEFTASGPDVDDLTRMLGLGDEGEGDIKIAGALQSTTDGPLTLSVSGNIGLTEIDASGEIVDLKNYGNIKLKMTASGPDLGRILRIVGIHQVRESPFMVKIDAESLDGSLVIKEASMVFADAHFDASANLPNFPSIDDAVIDVRIEGPDIERFRYITGIPGAASGPFSLGLKVDVRDDGVELLQLDTKTALGEIHGDGHIGDPDTFFGSEFNLHVRAESVARLAAAYGVADMPDKPAEIAGSIQYTPEGIRTQGPIRTVVDGNSVEIDGLVALEENIEGTDVRFKATAGDLAQLVAMFAEADGVPALPFELGGRLRARDDGIHVSGASGALGAASLSAEGLLVPADGIAGSWLTLNARGDRFEELFSGLEGVDVRPGPFGLRGRVAFRKDAIELTNVELNRQVGEVRLGLTIGLEDARPRLDFDVSADGRDVRAVLNRVQGFEAFEQPFSFDVKGRLRGPHWTFDKLDIVVGDATLTAVGDLEFVAASKATDFGFALNVPSLAALGTVNGRKFREQGLSLTANVSGGASELMTEEIDLRIGNSDVHGSVRVRKGDVPEIDVDIHADKLVYLPLLEEITEYEKAPEFDDGRLIPDVDIPFDAMKRVNATLVLDIAEFQRGKLYLSAVDVDARLRDGTLDVDTVQFRTLSGALGARASLAPDGGSGKASLQLVARDFAPGLVETNEDLAMKTDADLDLQSTGADLRTLAGNANGILYIDIRGGRLQLHEMITAIYGDMLEEMLSTINPMRKTDPYTDFECLIVPLTVTDGQVAGAPSIFVSTEKLRAVTQGSLNLKTEEIRVGVRTTPRRIVSISAAELFNPYVQVVGTLAAPKLAVDEAGVLITGGAAVATGGLTLLARGLWDRLSKAGDACKQVSKQARKELAGRFPDLEIEKPEHQE